MKKNEEKWRKNAKNEEKWRKIGTFLQKNEKKREKMRRFLTAENAEGAEKNWPRRHKDTEKNQPRMDIG